MSSGREISSVSEKPFDRLQPQAARANYFLFIGKDDSLVKSRVEASDYVHIFKITSSEARRTESESLVSGSVEVCQSLQGHFAPSL